MNNQLEPWQVVLVFSILVVSAAVFLWILFGSSKGRQGVNMMEFEFKLHELRMDEIREQRARRLQGEVSGQPHPQDRNPHT